MSDNELVTQAAVHYLALALHQVTREEALLVLGGQPPFIESIPWPTELDWEPAETPRENLEKARLLLDTALAEPGQAPVDLKYPAQHEVADWVHRNFGRDDISVKALGLIEEVGELARAIVKREQGVRGTYAEWTVEIGKELGDVFIKLLDVADGLGFDLATVAAKRWAVVGKRDFRADPRAHGLPQEDVA